jgi:Asp-tRNA(Asn)/Glu-tRNA(Gln) amidotransferase A subunit family amidase
MFSLLDDLAAMERGDLTPAAAVARSHERVLAQDAELRAFTCHDLGATAAPAGPLRGVTVGVKDIIDTADWPTEMGSTLYAGWRPRADAAVVMRLKALGATLLGKTATTPFAYLDPAPTRNPHALDHSPGGSSAGSAAAVAAGMATLAIGTQTGGSVIRPASYCGVAAVKPSFRLLPMVGVKPYAWTLDTLGLFAATVADCAFALAQLAERPALEAGAAEAPRIGVVAQEFAGDPEPESGAALGAAVRAAETAGARVTRLEPAPALAEAFAVQGPLQDFEARQALAWEYAQHRDALPPKLRQALDAAQALTAEEYDRARRSARRARVAVRDLFESVDAVLTFSSPGAAPSDLGTTGDSRFNRLWTMLGLPCVNVPGLRTGSGLPVGVQVIAPFARDERALAVAAFVERAIRSASDHD